MVTGHEAAELSGITSGVEGQDTRVIRRRPDATERRHSDAPTAPEGTDFYGPAVVGASTIGAAALAPDLLDEVLTDLAVLSTDAYLEYVAAFVADGRARAGAGWRYADITTVLAACATMLRPQSYLEIGVRRGRSMSVVAKRLGKRAVRGCGSQEMDGEQAGYTLSLHDALPIYRKSVV